MFKQIIAHIIIFVILVSLWWGYYFLDIKNKELWQQKEQMIEQQNQLQEEINKILKWKSIKKLNNSYELLIKYFKERQNILMLEMWIFLEYIYPNDNLVKNINIDKKWWKINLKFYSKDLEQIRRLYENLNFLKKEHIILEFNLSPVNLIEKRKVKNWNLQVFKFYWLQFKFNPNYSLIREFILKRNNRLKIPFQNNYILFKNDINKILWSWSWSWNLSWWINKTWNK